MKRFKLQAALFLAIILSLQSLAFGLAPQQPPAPRPPVETAKTHKGDQPKPVPPDRTIPVEELFGTWWSKGNEYKIIIEPLQKGDNSGLSLKGKHKDWAGTYHDGTLSFHRNPTFDEMSQKAPEWA